MKIYTVNCMPMVADVVSGAKPRPRARGEDEAWQAWLMQTPAWWKLDLAIEDLTPTADNDLLDLLGDAGGAFCVYDARGGDTICLNSDGTRAAIREIQADGPVIIQAEPPDGYFTPLEAPAKPTPPAADAPPRFSMGRIVATPGALEALNLTGDGQAAAAEILARHERGDWGDVDAEDWQANEEALNPEDPTRLLSAYVVNATRLWIITEWDRSYTTILLPDEY